MKSGNFNFLEPSGPLQACNGTALTLPSRILLFVLCKAKYDNGLYRCAVNSTDWIYRWTQKRSCNSLLLMLVRTACNGKLKSSEVRGHKPISGLFRLHGLCSPTLLFVRTPFLFPVDMYYPIIHPTISMQISGRKLWYSLDLLPTFGRIRRTMGLPFHVFPSSLLMYCDPSNGLPPPPRAP